MLLGRHGHTGSNAAGIIDTGYPGAVLSVTGRAQAQRLAKELADEPIDAVICSHLTRAQQTAWPIANQHGLTVQIDARLTETYAGDLDGRSEPASHEEFRAVLLQWAAGNLELPLGEGGETGSAALERFVQALTELGQRYENPLIVSHATLLMAWAAQVVGVPINWIASHPIENTGVIRVQPGSPPTMTTWMGMTL